MANNKANDDVNILVHEHSAAPFSFGKIFSKGEDFKHSFWFLLVHFPAKSGTLTGVWPLLAA